MGHTSILAVTSVNSLNPDESKYRTPKGKRVICEQAAYVMTDILKGNTDPSENRRLVRLRADHRQERSRRPAALKTGTCNDAKDLNAYGYIAPPSRQGRRTVNTHWPWACGPATATAAPSRRSPTRSSRSTWPLHCGTPS